MDDAESNKEQVPVEVVEAYKRIAHKRLEDAGSVPLDHKYGENVEGCLWCPGLIDLEELEGYDQ